MKPDKPGELRDVDVQCVSLVSKAANKRTFKIFKSADYKEPEPAFAPSPSEDSGLMRKVVEALKGVFTGVEKGDVMDRFNIQRRRESFWKAVDALATTLDVRDRWSDSNSVGKDAKTVDANVVSSALAEFTTIITGIFKDSEPGATTEGATTPPATEPGEAIAKSGRKISASRLAGLKDAHGILAQIIAEAEASASEGGTEVTKEELSAVIKAEMKGIEERLSAVEKAAVPPVAETEEEKKKRLEEEAKKKGTEVTKETLVEALKGALEPITARLEVVEKARGISNAAPADGTEPVAKSDGWGGIFSGVGR